MCLLQRVATQGLAMLRLAPVVLLAPLVLLTVACNGTDDSDDTTDDTDVVVDCVAGELRTYDTAAEPALYETPDPGLGFSPLDVYTAMLGEFTGTYTPVDSTPSR